MILYKLIFGSVTKTNRLDSEELIESYISVLLHNGQACGEYFHVVQNRELCAYLNVQGIHAHSGKYHCKYGIDLLNKVTAHFGRAPIWELIDDDAPKRDTTWTNAPFLYLHTHMNEWNSPLCRGDNGKPIPLYRFPGAHRDRETVYFWELAYRDCDSLWMGCGCLEIPTYRQLALPESELSEQGREICTKIEAITGVPTYYYLMRYWGRRQGEEKRVCPGCGGVWRTQHVIKESDPFWKFPFQCDRCRLVAHVCCTDEDERHAVIGEWRKRTKTVQSANQAQKD